MDKKLNLKDDEEHTNKAHYRWMKHLNRNTASPDYKDEWYGEQCFGCQYYMKLEGRLRTDWGVCSHPESPFDGRVMFEHDGCEHYSPVDEDDEDLLETAHMILEENNEELIAIAHEIIKEVEQRVSGQLDRKPNLKEDETHTNETKKRWLQKIIKNRNPSSPEDYKDEWYTDQCEACQYYMKLQGYLRTDWGVCSHPESPCDGRLMLEHDGCEHFSFAEDEEAL